MVSLIITEEEKEAVLALAKAYRRLKELGWRDIADFTWDMQDFGPAPFLGIELGSPRPLECEYEEVEDEGTFTTLEDDDSNALREQPREIDLIMFRHYRE
jgi:hypothetical protein